jgi:hypothetical protein
LIKKNVILDFEINPNTAIEGGKKGGERLSYNLLLSYIEGTCPILSIFMLLSGLH